MGGLLDRGRSTIEFDPVADHLRRYCGISRELASKRLHQIKKDHGFPGDRNVILDFTGNIFDPESRENIGSLTLGGAGEIA